MNIEPLNSWLPASEYPRVIAGPCSAETEFQTVETAKLIAKDPRVVAIRAGIWKPRTRPGSFEGAGESGLPWLQKVQVETGLPVTIEVGNAQHVELALKYGINILWIGAKTTVNPFSVQEIANALKGVDIPVMIKNPANPDLNLWIGAVERVAQAGIKKLAVIHRGFSSYAPMPFRHDPIWAIPIEFRRQFPEIPMICDPSHITGKWELLEGIAQKALDLSMDGLMIETHITPREAWSDARQQITPAELTEMLDRLVVRMPEQELSEYIHGIAELRTKLDDTDSQIIALLARRMETVKEIGYLKKSQNASILQLKRWDEVITHLMKEGKCLGLSEATVKNLYDLIHDASISVQEEIFAAKD